MKKSLIAVLALASVVACNKAEVIEQNSANLISFGNAFVNSSTKAFVDSADDFDSFQVFGTVNGTGIFDDVTVTKNGTAWEYESQYTQYWTNGTYNFAAIVNAASIESTDGVPTSLTTDLSEQKDVLYATATRDNSTTINDAVVPFTFNHQLARAKFTAVNNFSQESGIQIAVTDIAITNADKNGTLTIGNEANIWAPADTYTQAYNNLAKFEPTKSSATDFALVLPTTAKNLNIAFTVSIYNGDVLVKTKKHTLTDVTVELKNGYSYNFVMSLNEENAVDELKPITFTVDSVNGWTDAEYVYPNPQE